MNESELLFTELLNCDRLSLYLNRDLRLDKDKSSAISCVLKRRIFAEPLQYILGKAEFMGLEFKVTPDVLIPRQETEILAEKVTEIVRQLPCRPIKILDLGTGSGCIAISLAKFLPNAEISAVDISSRALAVAKENARLNKVEIKFIRGDLFNAMHRGLSPFDLIVSNPPYIPTAQIGSLQPEVRHEPSIALDGGKDGLDFYRKIISGCEKYLSECGLLIMEMGFGQRDEIGNIFQEVKNFRIREIIKDYNNIDRVIVAQKKKRWIN